MMYLTSLWDIKDKRNQSKSGGADTRAASQQSERTDGSEQTAPNAERFPPLANSISLTHTHHFPLLCRTECLHLLSGQFFWAMGTWYIQTTWRWGPWVGGGGQARQSLECSVFYGKRYAQAFFSKPAHLQISEDLWTNSANFKTQCGRLYSFQSFVCFHKEVVGSERIRWTLNTVKI